MPRFCWVNCLGLHVTFVIDIFGSFEDDNADELASFNWIQSWAVIFYNNWFIGDLHLEWIDFVNFLIVKQVLNTA